MPGAVEAAADWNGRSRSGRSWRRDPQTVEAWQDYSHLIERRAAAKAARIADGEGRTERHAIAICTKTGRAICAGFHREREYSPKQEVSATFDGQMCAETAKNGGKAEQNRTKHGIAI